MPISPALPAALRALVAVLALGSGTGWADELREASKLLQAGQHPQALERVNKALTANPRDPQARFLKGLILTDQGNSKEAVEVFEKLTRDHPELPEPYNNLAVIYAGQGQYDKARAALERAMRTHPTYATAYDNLGGVYAKLASQAYDKALQTGSANAGEQNKLVLVREMSDRAQRPTRTAAADKGPATQAVVAAAQPPGQSQPSAQTQPVAQPVTQPQPAARPRPVAAAKPAQSATPAAAADVLQTVNAWAKAWSTKDADAYLGFYAKDFVTPKGEPRAEWEKSRRQRIAAPKSIAVTVESPKVALAADGQASVTFRQGYRSDVTKVSANKTLLLVKSDSGWLIRQEKVGRN
jgi:Flp pilus assembly protein TadD/ketosteroid isomerase-like protein